MDTVKITDDCGRPIIDTGIPKPTFEALKDIVKKTPGKKPGKSGIGVQITVKPKCTKSDVACNLLQNSPKSPTLPKKLP